MNRLPPGSRSASFGATFTFAWRRGLAPHLPVHHATPISPTRGGHDTSVTPADGETLTLGFARAACSAISRSRAASWAKPMSGSFAVNARRPSAVPIHARWRAATNWRRRLKRRGRAADRTAGGAVDTLIRILFGPQDDEFGRRPRNCSPTAWRRFPQTMTAWVPARRPGPEAPARLQHCLRRNRQRQHSGAGQRPADRADAGSRHQRRLPLRSRPHLRPDLAASQRRRS